MCEPRCGQHPAALYGSPWRVRRQCAGALDRKMKSIITVLCALAIGCAARTDAPQTWRQHVSDSNITVVVRGEVSQPGTYSVPNGATICYAIATAGGVTEYAGQRVFLTRNGELSFHGLIRKLEESAPPALQHGDVVVVVSR